MSLGKIKQKKVVGNLTGLNAFYPNPQVWWGELWLIDKHVRSKQWLKEFFGRHNRKPGA